MSIVSYGYGPKVGGGATSIFQQIESIELVEPIEVELVTAIVIVLVVPIEIELQAPIEVEIA